MQKWHKNTNQNHVLKLLVEGHFDYFTVVHSTSVKNLFFMLSNEVTQRDRRLLLLLSDFEMGFQPNFNLLKLGQL